MSDEIIKQIGSDQNFIVSIRDDYQKFNEMSLINKAEAGKKLFIKFKQYEEAVQICGDTIYEQSLEIDELKDKLISFGEYNELEIKAAIQSKKLNTDNETKNKKIQDRLLQTINLSKALTDR